MYLFKWLRVSDVIGWIYCIRLKREVVSKISFQFTCTKYIYLHEAALKDFDKKILADAFVMRHTLFAIGELTN